MTSRSSTSRLKKAGYTSAAGLGLFLGAAGIAAASTGTGSSPDSPAVVEPTADEAEDAGVDCENGIDTATGDECDGGPAAAEADESTEAPDNEADELGDEADDGVDHQFEGEEVGENGDGIPGPNEADETEADD